MVYASSFVAHIANPEIISVQTSLAIFRRSIPANPIISDYVEALMSVSNDWNLL
jgi:hypothetical protein